MFADGHLLVSPSCQQDTAESSQANAMKSCRIMD